MGNNDNICHPLRSNANRIVLNPSYITRTMIRPSVITRIMDETRPCSCEGTKNSSRIIDPYTIAEIRTPTIKRDVLQANTQRTTSVESVATPPLPLPTAEPLRIPMEIDAAMYAEAPDFGVYREQKNYVDQKEKDEEKIQAEREAAALRNLRLSSFVTAEELEDVRPNMKKLVIDPKPVEPFFKAKVVSFRPDKNKNPDTALDVDKMTAITKPKAKSSKSSSGSEMSDKTLVDNVNETSSSLNRSLKQILAEL